MLDFRTIRVNGTTLAEELEEWLEVNIVDWEEMSFGLRRKYLVDIEEQLILAAEAGNIEQSAWLSCSYTPCYNCPVDLREYITNE